MILKIKNKKIDFFNSFNLTLKYDSVASVFSFLFFFNPDNPEHRELFKPCGYQPCTVEHNDELLITGRVLSHTFAYSPVAELKSLGGYSSPGVLEDCDIPPSLYPLESNGLSIREIASKLLNPFGLKMIVDPAVQHLMDEAFIISSAGENQKIKGYLSEISAQKNIVISHTEKGEVLFTSAKTNKTPLIHYTEGMPFTHINLTVDGQAMSSEITIMKQADPDNDNASEYTIKNPFVGTFRPRIKLQTSGTDINTQHAARNALGDELRNIKLTITTDRWVVDGKILRPNNIVSVTSPNNCIYNKTNFFIESINFTGDQEKTIAVLNCVLPSVYDNTTPINIFK